MTTDEIETHLALLGYVTDNVGDINWDFKSGKYQIIFILGQYCVQEREAVWPHLGQMLVNQKPILSTKNYDEALRKLYELVTAE